jgi:hypothetical protein
MIGTLFEQEEVDKKKHFYNLAVKLVNYSYVDISIGEG